MPPPPTGKQARELHSKTSPQPSPPIAPPSKPQTSPKTSLCRNSLLTHCCVYILITLTLRWLVNVLIYVAYMLSLLVAMVALFSLVRPGGVLSQCMALFVQCVDALKLSASKSGIAFRWRFSLQTRILPGISPVGLKFARFTCRANPRSRALFDRKEITHLEALETA